MTRQIRNLNNHRNLIPQSIMLLIVFAMYLMQSSDAQVPDTFESITEAYAAAMLNIADENELEKELEILLERATAFRDQTESAESIYLLARITYGYSGSQSVMGTRRSFREAKELLELALSMDEKVSNGNAKALLGYLYVGLPGWPMSFGDVDKGLELLDEAMLIDSENMTNNYFYTGGLLRAENYAAARDQLLKAKQYADPNSSTPLLHTLILREINNDLAEVEERLVSAN